MPDPIELHVRLEGSGPPVVFLHGGGPGCSSWADFRQSAEIAAPQRRRLFVDLAQYGDSAHGPITGPGWDHQAACLLHTLDLQGLGQVDIVAQSLGGSVALTLAAQHPDRVGRLVVTGSQPVPAPDSAATARALVREARSRYYGGEGPTPEKMRALIARLEWFHPERLPSSTVMLRYEHSITPWAMAGADGSGRGEPQDLSDLLAGIEHPTLWLWGSHDPFAGPDYAVALAASMPHADVSVLARTSHHPQEERPHAYGRIVREFLERKEDQ
ncbi:alpha/beta fold hydrolase [Aeromicrobium piscarium]|uniref:Alpha/beta hydrolase n=1 Tax=Aeromicrobium piscarium TaxID=2590901 RepID=A0A554SD72_9ACTN|nr:alpha/beta hydrolase [Aeromicrobium piscarium]TSD64294.1 alpha/beta hydrolase [Aeromicrobium piscarium]